MLRGTIPLLLVLLCLLEANCTYSPLSSELEMNQKATKVKLPDASVVDTDSAEEPDILRDKSASRRFPTLAIVISTFYVSRTSLNFHTAGTLDLFVEETELSIELDTAVLHDQNVAMIVHSVEASPTYRLNYKIASIPSSTIFAQATGFKVTWKLPSSGMEKRKRRNVDDIHESAELVYDSHGFDGKACLAKNICQALDYISGREGVIVKILKLLTKKTYDNGTISALDKIACEEFSARCPLELLGINGLIDTSNNEI